MDEGEEFAEFLSALEVEAVVFGDAEDVGECFRGGLVAGGSFPEVDEDVLGDVFGCLVVDLAEESCGETDDGLLVSVDNGCKCCTVAVFDGEHEGFVGCRVIFRHFG